MAQSVMARVYSKTYRHCGPQRGRKHFARAPSIEPSICNCCISFVTLGSTHLDITSRDARPRRVPVCNIACNSFAMVKCLVSTAQVGGPWALGSNSLHECAPGQTCTLPRQLLQAIDLSLTSQASGFQGSGTGRDFVAQATGTQAVQALTLQE